MFFIKRYYFKVRIMKKIGFLIPQTNTIVERDISKIFLLTPELENLFSVH